MVLKTSHLQAKSQDVRFNLYRNGSGQATLPVGPVKVAYPEPFWTRTYDVSKLLDDSARAANLFKGMQKAHGLAGLKLPKPRFATPHPRSSPDDPLSPKHFLSPTGYISSSKFIEAICYQAYKSVYARTLWLLIQTLEERFRVEKLVEWWLVQVLSSQ